MSLLTRSEVIELNEHATSPSVSLYLPTHRAGREIRQDPIRLKNLLKSATGDLVGNGHDKQAAEDFLAPAWKLVGDADFWRHQSDGLAIFLADGFFRSYRLPVSFDELAVVSSRFHLKPLLPLLTGDGRFYVLALSQKRVRLFEGGRDRMKEIDFGDALPRSLADAVGYDFEERSLQFRTGVTSGSHHQGKRGAIFHGHGAGDDDLAELEQFLRRLDSALGEVLDDPPRPLMLAGAEPLPGTFRKVSDYPRLVEGTVAGNHDETTTDEMHERAWPLVEPLFREAQRESRERLQELTGTDKTCAGTREVVRAAHDGRIDVLFVPVGHQRWGRYDPGTREVLLHDDPVDDDRDLLDVAALQTLTHGGTVFAVAPEEVPASGDAAAILRY